MSYDDDDDDDDDDCVCCIQRWSTCRVVRRATKSMNYATVLILLSVYDVPTTTNTNVSDVRRKRLF